MVTAFRTQRNYVMPSGQTFVLPSLTVPDQSLSLADLLLNHTRPQLEPIFDENMVMRDPRSYDIAEIEQMRKELEEEKLFNRNVIRNELSEKKRRQLERDEKAKAEAGATIAPVI